MIEERVADSTTCAQCGASNTVRSDRCWLCHAALSPAGQVAAAGSLGDSPFAAVHQEAQRTFTLSSLFLVMTLIAVCLGVLVQAPGLGVPLAVLSAPALIRTVWVRSKRKTRGQPMTVWDKALVFLGSLAIVATIAASAAGAFVGICFSLGWVAFGVNSQGLFALAWLLGIGGGLLIAGLLFRWLWWRGS